MPELDEIRYSREECVAAIRDYYHFLTSLYLDESNIAEPPAEGWPSITPEALQSLGKTKEVVALLRRLPYIRDPKEQGSSTIEGAPRCWFADWARMAEFLGAGDGIDAQGLKVMTENLIVHDIDNAEELDLVPPHVVGLTLGGRDNSIILLDTELGIIHWTDCPTRIMDEDGFRDAVVTDDACDYAPEEQVEWRNLSPAWAISDFFEMLKNQYLRLQFIPTSSTAVKDAKELEGSTPQDEGVLATLQDIYRQHGWPDRDQYRKAECLKAVRQTLTERYPHLV